MSDPRKIELEFPEALDFLFEPARYKVAWGGRGGAKSWGFGRALLTIGAQNQTRIVCAREIQKSIQESVHALLEQQIRTIPHLTDCYEVQETRILGHNGTEITFAGLRHNVNSIKSLEGADICWVEEAQTVSKRSWDILIPTIRKEGSEIWVSFNPDLETDETYRRWVVRPPKGAIVRKLNYTDNPWCPQTLLDEAAQLKESNPDDYNHIWEGCCKSVLDGAIYADELRAVDRETRITRVPYDRTKPVHTFWDLGWADNTSIWFVQPIGFEYRVIDFVSDSGKALQHYQQQLQAKGYVYGTHWLPHDARAKNLGTGRSVEELMRAAGFNVQIVPQLSIADGITAVRSVFPQCWFDAGKCADGVQALRHYVYGEEEKKNVGKPETVAAAKTKVPLHNWASHPADAFRMFGVAIKPPKPKTPAGRPPVNTGGWAG